MAHEEPPSYLMLELKTSRTDKIPLDKRDLEGIKNDGYLVVVLDEPGYEGPVLGFIPHSEINVGTHNKSDLRQKQVTGAWWVDEINSSWSDWILNIDALNDIISAKHSKVPKKIDWYLRMTGQEKGLKKSRRKGAARAQFLRLNLEELHQKMDAQIEGQFHQYLVRDIIKRSDTLRYEPVNNPTGVPDIHARRLKGFAEILEILMEWGKSSENITINFDTITQEEVMDLYRKIIL